MNIFKGIRKLKIVRTANRNVALALAVKYNFPDLIEDLVSKGADINSKDENGKTVLMHACSLGKDRIVSSLLKAGAEVNARDNWGVLAIIEAAKKGYVRIVEKLIQAGSEIDAKEILGGSTALIEAAQNGQVRIVDKLLQVGAEVDSRDNCGMTPLMWASRDEHVEIVKKLLRHGAKTDVRDYREGATALMIAAKYGQIHIVEKLLEAGANIDLRDYRNGATALIRATRKGNVFIVERLLRAEADMDMKDNRGKTAFMYATHNRHRKLTDILSSAKAEAVKVIRDRKFNRCLYGILYNQVSENQSGNKITQVIPCCRNGFVGRANSLVKRKDFAESVVYPDPVISQGVVYELPTTSFCRLCYMFKNN